MKELITDSQEKTERTASEFVRKLKKGDVVALSGSLGSGKTTFVKGMAKGLGIKEYVKSPTFTLLHIYKGRIPIFHFDLYRLVGDDYESLDFDDHLYEPEGIAVLEWAEKIKNDLPKNVKWVRLSYIDETRRRIRFE
jgi:tRNA threonylcarbamoyladenosine biosynthesis protein TsaE